MTDLRLRVPELAKTKAHKEGRTINSYVISNETGLAFNTADDYWHDRRQRLDRRVLLVLCEYLECSIEELLVEVEDPQGEASNQPAALSA